MIALLYDLSVRMRSVGDADLMRCDRDQISFVDPAVMPFPGLIQLHDCGRASVRITNHS
jgi:hypothetical protein